MTLKLYLIFAVSEGTIATRRKRSGAQLSGRLEF